MKGLNMMEELKDKVVVVTGGSRGIGAAIAKGFAELGSNIAIIYRSDQSSAETCAKEINRAGSRCLLVKARVEKANEVKRAIRKVVEKYGQIDVLVNSAGIWKDGQIGSMTEEQWDETIDINLKGTFLFCNEIARLMKKNKSGRIINISSTAGQRGEPLHSHYAASKGGIIAFTKSIAVELAPYNIKVNCVSPGWVNTDMTRHVLSGLSFRSKIRQGIPRGKVAVSEDIVGSVLFLASNLSNHIIGATISVNGGSVLF
jgi:3-oxoacyl-[acyl-carrier protein] reductase